jgi:hypothetical protein
MLNHFTPAQLIVVMFAVVFVVAVGVAAYLQKRKTRSLRNRRGSEYDRAVLKQGPLRKAEPKLDVRETRAGAQGIHKLSAGERERFVAQWNTVQARFVDHPKAAVTEADGLIAALLEARGYPRETFEHSAADLSVTYARVMEGYRIAHAIAVRPRGSEATTEELRIAMIQSCEVFEELIQDPNHDRNPHVKRSAA